MIVRQRVRAAISSYGANEQPFHVNRFDGRFDEASVSSYFGFEGSPAAKCSAIGVPANFSRNMREKNRSELSGR